MYFTGLATVLQLVLGVALALVLNRPFRGKGLVRAIFLLPMVATPVAIALVWMMMYNPTLGVMNYLVGLAGLGPDGGSATPPSWSPRSPSWTRGSGRPSSR